MIQQKKVLWLGYLSVGGLAVLSALIFLCFFLLRQQLSLIPGLVLLLSFAGGLWLLWQGLRGLTLASHQALLSTPDASNKNKKEALENLNRIATELKKRSSRCLSLSVLLLAAVIFLGMFALAHPAVTVDEDGMLHTGVLCERARVLSVDSESYQGQQAMEDQPIGEQWVTVELSSGPYKGTRLQLKNDLGVLYGTVLGEGDRVIVAVSLEEGSLSGNQTIWAYDRTLPLLIVFVLFLLITTLVGGKVGAKSLLGLCLTFVCIISIMIPLLIRGWPTIPTILGMCIFITVVEFTILDGINKKSLCAMLGTISGVVLAALFAQLASLLLRINGYIMNDADSMVEALLNFKRTQDDPFHSLQIADLLVGGILIAALGAVNDVAMSISSSMNELISVNPTLTRKDLFRSGMNIGRDMVGTMTNTLILALAGSSLVAMIYFSTLEPTWNELMSSAYLSIEAVQALSSSIGVILAVPVTVLIGMFFYGHSSKNSPKKKN